MRLNSLSYSRVRLLFTVMETFTVQGRGIVLLPELRPVGTEASSRRGPAQAPATRRRRRDRSYRRTSVSDPLSGKCELAVMLLGKEKGYVPIGSEVWSVEGSEMV